MEKVEKKDSFLSKISNFKKKNKSKTNLPIDWRLFFNCIEENRLFFEETESYLYFFIDERNYYILFYLIREKIDTLMISADKKVLINENILSKNSSININQFYIDSGFKVVSINEQYQLNVIEEISNIQTNYYKAREFILNKGYSILEKESFEDYQVKTLWEDSLKDTDIPLAHYRSGKIITINDGALVIGAAWYKIENQRSEWRHIVVKDNYRRQGIANCLLFFYLNSLVNKEIKSSITWINKNNKASIAFHKKTGFIKNNRISVQYVLE